MKEIIKALELHPLLYLLFDGFHICKSKVMKSETNLSLTYKHNIDNHWEQTWQEKQICDSAIIIHARIANAPTGF